MKVHQGDRLLKIVRDYVLCTPIFAEYMVRKLVINDNGRDRTLVGHRKLKQ